MNCLSADGFGQYITYVDEVALRLCGALFIMNMDTNAVSSM